MKSLKLSNKILDSMQEHFEYNETNQQHLEKYKLSNQMLIFDYRLELK